jgi:tetratricopeptide (TPR) repeat protein
VLKPALGVFLVGTLALLHGLATDHEESFAALDQAQRKSPHDPNITKAWLDAAAVLATEAADCIEKKDYQRAKRLLDRVRRPLENSASWNNLIGYAEFKLDQPEPALRHLQKALALEPDNEDYLLDIGEFLAYHRAHKESADLFEVAAKRMPNSARVQFGLAVAYILQNRRDEAIVLLKGLISRHPRFEPAYGALGECYEDAGDGEALVDLGRKLQSVNSSNPSGWYLEGAGLLRLVAQGQATLGPAVERLKSAVQLAPSSARYHFTLAKAYQESGAYELAVSELKQTLALDSQHERAHYVLGRLYQRLGKRELAAAELKAHSMIKQQDRTAQYRRLLITSRMP